MSLLKIYWRAMKYLAAEKAATTAMCVVSVLVALVMLADPILFGHVIQSISDKGDIFTPIAMWAALGVFNIVAAVFVARGADRLAHRRRLGVMIDSYERLITMPLAWHQKRGTSNALHTLIRATDSLFTLWLEFMRQHLTTVVALVTLIPVAMRMDLRMSMVLVVLGVIYVMIGQLVMRKTKDGQTAVEQHHHKLFEHVSDTISNVSVVQSYNRIASETQALRDYADTLEKAQFPVLNWWALASGLNRMASTFSMVVVLVLGAYFVTKGQMHVGDVVAFIGFAQLMIGRLDQISAFINQTVTARAKLEEFFEMEDATADRQEPDNVADLQNVKGDIVFDNVTLDDRQVLGEVGNAFAPLQRRLGVRRMEIAARCLGLASRCIEMMIEQANGRSTFGRPLADRQTIQWWIADSYQELEMVRLLTYRLASRVDRGDPDLRTEASMAKVQSTEMITRVVDRAIQTFGGMGVSKELPLEYIYRAVRVYRIVEGPSEVHRWVIARDLLKNGLRDQP